MRLLAITTTTDLPEAHLLAELCRTGGITVTLLGNLKPYHQSILSAAGVTIAPIYLSSRISRCAITTIRNTAREYQPDIIHSFSNRALSNSLIATRGLRCRHVAYRGAIGNVSRWDPLSWMTYLHPRLDKIICVSRAVEDYLAGVGVAREKLRTIYKGHRLSWYEGYHSDTPLASPTDTITIGCTANMRPVKGVDILLKAAKRIPATTPLHLILIGEIRDKQLPPLIASVSEEHRVTVVGYQENPIPYVRSCDIFVMPSRDREGLPKAVIEAMSQGVAPIVTRVGGMPELVVDGACGLVVEPNSPEQLATAIMSLASDRERTALLGARARTRLAEHFTLDATVAETIVVYDELLTARS
jgi:glycosyltransferase involved in cell wall biosynthesis